MEFLHFVSYFSNFRHSNGRVLVALANGLVAVFRRGPDAQWNLNSYHTVHLGGPQNSVRCMTVVHNTVWCGYKNKVHVLDPVSLVIKVSFLRGGGNPHKLLILKSLMNDLIFKKKIFFFL